MAELLAKEALENRLKYITNLYKDCPEEYVSLGKRLKEKGTEYTIVFPIFETLLELDPLKHIHFEYSSDDYNNQRFDLAIDSKSNKQLLVEVKSLEKQITNKDKEQLGSYLDANYKCPWGILTNGFEWWFYICTDYITTVANEGEQLTQNNDNVLNLMKLNINDEHFFEFMKNFKFDNLDEIWKKIANYCLKIIESRGGKHPKIHDGHKEIDEYVKDKIRDKLEIQKGEYFDLLREGKLKEGDIVTCINDFLKVEFKLDSTGKLNLINGEIKDYKTFCEYCFSDKFANWIKDNISFHSPRDFRIALDRHFEKRETHNLRTRYPFYPDLE